jgi:hypothetical protein
MPEAPSPSIRASDTDRERTAQLLGDHLAAGRLDAAEFEQRLTDAYAATTIAELERLLADLPAGVSASARPAADVAAPVLRAAWSSWALTALICLLIWTLTSFAQGHPLYFWPGWVIGPWGLVLLFGRTVVGLPAVSRCANPAPPGRGAPASR